LLIRELLWSHERGSARLRSTRGEPAGLVERAGDAEVDHPRPVVVRQQHVARLEVAVDQPGLVDRGERGGHAEGDGLEVAMGEGAALVHVLLQGDPGHVLRHQVRLAPIEVRVEHLRDAGLGHMAGQLGLPAEPFQIRGIGGELRGMTLIATCWPSWRSPR
jgi:hypothetical protein